MQQWRKKIQSHLLCHLKEKMLNLCDGEVDEDSKIFYVCVEELLYVYTNKSEAAQYLEKDVIRHALTNIIHTYTT